RGIFSSSGDATVLFWDTTAVLDRQGDAPGAMSPRTLEKLWADLAASDARRAYDALCRLVAAPKHAVPFLSGRLQPMPKVAPQDVARLIRDLDSKSYAVRARATAELETLHRLAEPALRAMLKKDISLEMHQRLEQLLDKLGDVSRLPQHLRRLRVVEALEYMGTMDAQKLLARLAGGAPEALLTGEAQGALRRLRCANPKC